MNCKLLVVLIMLLSVACSSFVAAAELNLKSADTIQKVLEDQKGKRVTVRLNGNDELTGKVRMITKDLLHLGELAGKEFFDAVIDVNKISAVIIRVKE